jgi:hypothetical protein
MSKQLLPGGYGSRNGSVEVSTLLKVTSLNGSRNAALEAAADAGVSGIAYLIVRHFAVRHLLKRNGGKEAA